MDASEGGFRISVNDCIGIFRDAVIALIPFAERARLTWEDVNPHDDWERIAEMLFNVFVARPIMLDASAVRGQMPLPPYDYDVDSYSQYSWIEVYLPNESQGFPLIRLLSQGSPFDAVQLARIDPDSLGTRSRVTVPWDGAEFFFRRRLYDGSSKVIAEVWPTD